jgi:TolB-like protein/Tfp pilus assembly protein PilF
LAIPPGTKIGRYELVAELGAGGMGEVYRARDARLQREVALKILPAALAGDPVHVERFQREARAVAALSHPNIVTIHSVEEAEGSHFLTMELIEGRPLDSELPAAGYPAPQLLEIGLALADGLAAAHERGIVHRDLKPSNVMIDRRGRVKLLDFGLAKDTGLDGTNETETRVALTHAGLIVGTMPYMAPEQIEARAVDARTDIFSLGTMLYEFATGERPFSGDSSARLMAAILRDDPRPIADRRLDLPPAFGRLVSRCLEKRPDDRVQTARDVYNELKSQQREAGTSTGARPVTLPRTEAVRPPSSGADRASGLWTTVLPFTARGGDADITALAEGLTEDVTAGLIKFPYLKIVAASGPRPPASARYVVQGSLRRAGAMLRVSVELIDSESGVHLWAERFDREFAASRIFEIQDDLAARVIVNVGDSNGALVIALAATVHDRDASSLSVDELVWRTFAADRRGDPAENALLVGVLEKALTREPAHAEGWACLAWLCGRAHLNPATGVADAVPRQRAAARRAIDIDPANQRGWCELATAAFYDRDEAAFKAAAERAMALNPLNANIMAFLSHLIGYTGDWSRGCEILERTMALGGQHPGWYHYLPFANHFRLGEYEKAWEVIKRVNMLEYPWTLVSVAGVAARLERWDDVRSAVATLRRVAPWFLDPENAKASVRLMHWDDKLVEDRDAAYRDALRYVEQGTPTQRPPSSSSGRASARQAIAVLPFANLSADPENEYFGDGLAEDILNALTAVDGLNVIARTSAFAFKGKSDDVRKIGEQLGVGTVLEGSVRRSGARVRVTAQLVETASGTHLWSQRYDRDITDIFAVQDDVAQAIAAALRGTLAPTAQARRYTPGVPAYEAFLKGRAQLIRFTPDSWERARTYLEEAIALDSDYADPHAELALGYFIRGMHGMAPMREVAPYVRAEAERALTLDPSNERPRFVLGAIALAHDYDWEAATAHFAASMRGPGVPAHAHWIHASLVFHALGHFEESSAEMKRAVEQDPLNATWHGILAAHLTAAGRPEDGLASAQRANEIEPNYYVSLLMLGATLWSAGRQTEALDALRQSHRLAPWFGISAGYLATALRQAGHDEEADRVLASMGPSPRPLWGLVRYELMVGSLDAAADLFERMIEERDPFALVYAISEATSRLRAHPRWPALAAAMNLPSVPPAS